MSVSALSCDHKTQQSYQLAIGLFPGPAFTIDRQRMKFICVNQMMCESTGYTENELLQLGLHDLVPSFTKHDLELKFDEIIYGGKETGVLVIEHKRKSGIGYLAEISLRALRTETSTLLVASQRDLTQQKIVEEKLKESEEQLRLLVDNFKDHAIYMIDAKGIIQTWNEGAANIKGYTSEEVLGRSMSVFYLSEDVENSVVDIILQVAKEKGSIETEGWRVRKNGTTFWASVTLSAIYDGNGRVQGFAKITRDITEQRILKEKAEKFNGQLKEEVRHKTAELTRIFERIADAFVAVDNNWCYRYLNKKTGEIFNVRPEDLVGKPMGHSYPEIFDQPFFQKYKEAMQEQRYTVTDAYFPLVDRWFLHRIYPSPEGLSIFLTDITDQKKVQDQLAKSELRYHSLVEHASDAIVITDECGTYIDVNSSACNLLGYTREEILGMNASDILHDLTSGTTLESRYEQLKSGQSIMRELFIRRKEGTLVEVESHSVMLPDGRFLGILRNITARKKIETKLKASEASLKEAQRLAHIGDWDFDYINKTVDWSDEVYEIFGVPKDSVPSYELFLQLVHPEERQWIDDSFKKSIDQGIEYDLVHRMITKDYMLKYVHGKGKTFYDEEGKPLRSIGTVQDITDRKRAEDQLQRSEAIFKRVFESNMVGFLFYNRRGHIIDANDRFLAMIGYDRQDLHEGKIKWNLLTPPEYAYLDQIGLNEIERTGISQPFDKEYIHKDGRRIPITIGAASLGSANADGVAFIIDISQRKRAEDEMKQSQLELRQLAAHLQTIREEERASMAREIHDELGQQLTGLKMDLYWLNSQTQLAEDERKKKLKATIKLVDQTINTVRKIAAELHPSMLDDLGLIEALGWYSQEFQNRFGITVRFHSSISEVNVDPKVSIGLFRIYQESLTNVARHAEAKSVNSTFEFIDHNAILKIVDDGKGFDRLKTPRKKTLGLLGMKERTLMMGGQYEITSMPGKGTTVSVIVPLFSKT